MRRATSTVKGSLRAASIAITLITVVTFATMGYSAYQVYLGVTAPGFAGGLKQTSSISGGEIVITTSGKFANAGLYPIDFSMQLGTAGVTSSSNPVSIAPGETKQFNLSTSLNPLGAPGGTTAAGVFYNGSDLPLAVGFAASLVPFASLETNSSTTVHLAPFAGGLHVVSASASGGRLEVTFAFTNGEAFAYPFTAAADFTQGGATFRSSELSAVASPGQETSFTLYFTGSSFAAGTYDLTFHMTVGGHDLPAHVVAEAA